MNHILLAGLGSPGDINPFIAIALALEQKGYHPVFLSNPYDVPIISKYGIEILPVGEKWDLLSLVASNPRYLLSPQAGLHTTRDIFIPYSRNLYPATLDAIRRLKPAAVVSHAFCYGSIWAARAEGILNVVAHLAPLSLMTRTVFDVYPRLRRLLFSMAVPMGKAQFNKIVKPLCDELSVPWHKRILEETMTAPDALLGMWPKTFFDLDAGPTHHGWSVCGFPTLSAPSTAVDPSLDAFMKKGDPPVVITLGTNAFAFAGDFFVHALKAVRRLGFRPLVITKKKISLELPSNGLAVEYADYDTLFPQCRAVIHHGGIGVTAQALKAGVPSVVVPFGHDQEDNGLRVERLGAGRRIHRNKIHTQLLAALAEVLFPEVVEQAASLGAQLFSEPNGADVAATIISSLLEPKRRAATA